MNRRQAVIYGLTGQTLEVYPPEWVKGAPSGSPTYSIWKATDSNDNTAELSGNATIDNVSTTVDVASGYSQTNRRRLYLAATTDIERGRPYVLANASSQRELVVPDAIASSDYVDLEYPLAYDYPVTTSTLKGFRIYLPVDSTWVADESNINSPQYPYRVLWTYAIEGVTYKTWTYFDLVRQVKVTDVTAADLAELYPDIRYAEPLGQRGQGFARQIDAAFERVEFDAAMHGVSLNQLRDGQLFNELVRAAAIMIISQNGWAPTGRDRDEFREERTKQYRDDFMQAIGVLKLAVDQGKEGAITEQPLRQFVFRR